MPKSLKTVILLKVFKNIRASEKACVLVKKLRETPIYHYLIFMNYLIKTESTWIKAPGQH